MSIKQIFVLALGVLFFSFGSVTIQAPAEAAAKCYQPSLQGFKVPRNDYEAGKCNPATNGKNFAGKCNICRGHTGDFHGTRRCFLQCKSGYSWVKSHPLLTKDGLASGCCTQ